MDYKVFENDVKKLLHLRNWRVEDEQLIAHKKVDALISKTDDFGDQVTIAVECKFYKSRLSQKVVSEIYSNYLPLVQNNLVNSILLVSENGLHPSAENFVRGANGFKHITRHLLQDSILDFSSYIRGTIDSYEKSNLSKYYVRQKIRNENQYLDDYVKSYINGDGREALAILGGYGTGKSSFSSYLAHKYSLEYSSGENDRIPILLNLGDISDDQSLEGLLGKKFTSETIVDNYNFHLFMSLNEIGKFLFILDGFDEMKRMMSWESLKYNLSQINRLLLPKTRAILLGRPTAFLNESEQKEALRGLKETRNGVRKIPDQPTFEEIYIKPFSKNEIAQFITSYSNTLAKANDQYFDAHKVRKFAKAVEMGHGSIQDIVSRPVQLKMLIEILPDFDGDLKKLTISELYAEFFDLVADRESRKKARHSFSAETRRNFIKELAYMMWQKGMTHEIASHEIPENIVLKHCPDGEDIAATKRELIVGSILDRKGTDGFYFAHRSFQEFLVAEAMVDLLAKSKEEFWTSKHITPEVAEFLIDMLGKQKARLLTKNVKQKSGGDRNSVYKFLSREMINLFARMCDHYGIRSPVPIDRSTTPIDLPSINKRGKNKNLDAGILHVSKQVRTEAEETKKAAKKRRIKDTVKRDFSRR